MPEKVHFHLQMKPDSQAYEWKVATLEPEEVTREQIDGWIIQLRDKTKKEVSCGCLVIDGYGTQRYQLAEYLEMVVASADELTG